MDIRTLKLEIVRQVLETERKDLLDRLYDALKEKDFWSDLTEDQKNEIEVSRKQIQNGETESWDSIYERLRGNG